uniref:hypothetical protein n=1 Tax=Aeromonas salmonicida TaxID=645 RepID=UPI00215A4D8C|nr:hypothetical protein [Aeromonas salmonicida]
MKHSRLKGWIPCSTEKLGIKNADYWTGRRSEQNLEQELSGHPFEPDPDTITK